MRSLRRPGRSGKGSPFSRKTARTGPPDGREGLIQRAAPCLSCLALPTAPGCYTGVAAAHGGAERWLAAGVVLNKSNRPPILRRTPRSTGFHTAAGHSVAEIAGLLVLERLGGQDGEHLLGGG